ncbi:L,D-transpeptidase family protein [Rhizobium sp. SGZ-381]|uniref:L,D-transpeptidase family protein n=1 Tax=Rhizobium sp. SGZ-381 TaxID=3342800 RepID=UPI00366D43D8
MLRSATLALVLVSGTALPTTAAEEARTLQIIVSTDSQQLTVYDGDRIVARSNVSTGKPGHDTPTGIFSVLEKRKYHESNIYSAAPMPWMQRLTWSGIALHESNSVPRYPASHGCVRMPAEFARQLYRMTTRGVHVIISDSAVAPQPVRHAALFSPLAEAPPDELLSDVSLRSSAAHGGAGEVQVAMNMPPAPVPVSGAPEKTVTPPQAGNPPQAAAASEPAPLRILITRRDAKDTVRDVQDMLSELGFDAGTADGIMGSATRSALAGFKRWKALPLKGPQLTPDLLAALYASAGRTPPPAGQILVRQGFQDILSEPVAFKDPERALGTHFLSVIGIDRDKGDAEWRGLSLQNDLSDADRKRLAITQAAPEGPGALSAVLDRISIPEDVRMKISTTMSTGTSLTITDTGNGIETTAGTDFITLTHRGPRA